MSRPWAPEQTISPELAAALIGDQFPNLRPVRAGHLSDGWDNTAFIVNDEWVFRFPRREIAVDLLETESKLLPAIATRLPLPIPVPTMVGEPEKRFPWPFAGYRMLRGETACRANPDASQRCAAAEALAEFLAALHAIPADEAREFGAPPDRIGRLDLARRTAQIAERLDQLVTHGIIAEAGRYLAIADDVPAGFTPADDTLVHGDFYVRHLLVDEAGRPTGIIDWGDVHLGDAAIDLSIAYSFLPSSAHATFQRAYGGVAEDVWRIARFKALHCAVMILAYGHDIGDADLLREGLQTLEWVVS